jgi:hypothetical protein
LRIEVHFEVDVLSSSFVRVAEAAVGLLVDSADVVVLSCAPGDPRESGVVATLQPVMRVPR